MTENALETEDATVTPLTFAQPEFNQAEYVVDDLAAKNGQLQKENSLLKSQVAQLTGVMRANADKLGLVADAEGNLSVAPQTPNRATRRAATKRTPRSTQ